MTLISPAPDRALVRAIAPSTVRPLVKRMHFYAGLFVAPLLALLCLTGLAYAFTPELDAAVYAHEFTAPAQETPRPLAAQVAAAEAAHPQWTVESVAPPTKPDRTTAVTMTAPGMSDRTVYVDPYTAGIRGVLSTVNGRPPLQEWLRELHGNLHGGTVGRWYSETAASWLPILIGGGLVLWLGRRRGARSSRLVPTGRRAGRARSRAWHGCLGLWLALGLAGLSATGLTWSHYAGARFERLVTAADGHTPELKSSPITAGARTIPVDAALATARQAGLREPLSITVPDGPTAPYTISETGQSWPIHRDQVGVDPYRGQLTGRLDFADYPLLAKLTTIGILAHQGTLFGLPNAIALAVFAVATLALIGFGYRMWWQRRPAAGGLPPTPARGGWRSIRPATAAIGVALAVLLAWALPLLGVTLAGFLCYDVLRALVLGIQAGGNEGR